MKFETGKYEAEHGPYDETGTLIYLSTTLYDHQHHLRQLNINLKFVDHEEKYIQEENVDVFSDTFFS